MAEGRRIRRKKATTTNSIERWFTERRLRMFGALAYLIAILVPLATVSANFLREEPTPEPVVTARPHIEACVFDGQTLHLQLANERAAATSLVWIKIHYLAAHDGKPITYYPPNMAGKPTWSGDETLAAWGTGIIRIPIDSAWVDVPGFRGLRYEISQTNGSNVEDGIKRRCLEHPIPHSMPVDDGIVA